MNKPTLIKKIEQIDNYTLLITWQDDIKQNFRLSELQKNCPCANCVDEKSGQRLIDENKIQENVKATYIRSVGRYALQIQFTSGCSTGIYSFDRLRSFQNLL